MASLSNINGLFDVHSTGAILFSTSHGTSGQILKSNGNAAPTWIPQSDIVGAYLPLAGGTLTGATATASGISFTVGGALTVGGNNVVGFNGSWNGANMPGSRFGGYSVNGGEIVFQRDNPNSGQMSILVDGGYYAGENNGFYSLYSSNSYNSKAGFAADTSGILQFNAPATFAGLVSGITPTAAANFVTKAYADGLTPGAGVFLPLAGGTLTGALVGTTATFTGNVGIGTTSPSALLHVKAPDGTIGSMILGGGNNPVTAVEQINTELNFGSNDASATGGIGGSIKTVTEYSNGAYVGMSFYTCKQGRTPVLAEAMRITHAGGISFGTTGAAWGTSGQVLTSAGNTTPTWTTPTTGTVTGTGTNDYIPKWNAAGTGIENSLLIDTGALSYTTSQSVILTLKGTSAPGYAEINIKNDANNFINIGSIGSTYSGADWTNSAYVYNTGTGRNLWLKSQNDLGLFAGGTSIASNKRMTILSAGNIQMTTKLAIGATTPQNYRLQLGLNGSLVDSIAMGNYAVAKNTRQYIGYTRADTGLFESSGNGDTPSTVLAGVAGVRIVNTEGTVASTQADNSVQLLTHIYNGSSRVALHANYDGKVGIGTTSPGALLHLVGNTPELRIATAADGQTARLGLYEDSAGTNHGGYIQYVGGGDTLRLGIVNSAVSTDVITIKDNFNVGIGTTSPGQKLQVNGSIKIANSNSRLVFGTSGGTDRRALEGNTSGSLLQIGEGYTDIALQGNVGIGTTSPDSLLQLESSANPDVELKISNTATVVSGQNFGGSKVRLIADGTNGDGEGALRHALVSETDSYDNWEIRTGNELGTLAFDTLGSEWMRITSGGNVLVAKTSQGLSITGIELSQDLLRVTRSSAAPVEINRKGTDGTIVNFYKDTASKGNISITSSAVAYNTSSDYRLKEDLKDFNGLDKVSKIPVYDFKWKSDESRSYGVMAHELQKVLPDAVSGEKDAEEMQGVDYSKIVPLLVKSIQELESKIKKLENK